MKRLLLGLALVVAPAATGEIISSDRRYTWQGNVGVSNGIPNSASMTIFTNVQTGTSISTINAVIAACPSNQVVKLASGDFSFGDDLIIGKDGVVVKGAGRDSTHLEFGLSSNERMRFRKSTSEAALSVEANLSEDAVKGATSVTLASVPSWVTVGELIGIDQLNESSFVADGGTSGGDSYRDQVGNGDRGLAMLNRVLAKTATTITLEIPLTYGFKTAQTAQIWEPFTDLAGGSSSLKRAGLEDMTLTYLGSGNDSHGISLENAVECWVKNVAITNTYGGSAIMPFFSYRCSFVSNYIHSSHLYTGGQGYGITPWHVTTACLIEDNIFFNLHNPMSPNLGANANVFAYNYVGAGQSTANQNPGFSTHSVHTFMNLFEGNVLVDKGPLADWTHGSGSHNTSLRNRILGNNGTGDNRTCVSVEYYNRYWNIVGNIVGTPSLQNKLVAHSGDTSGGSEGTIFRLGGEVNINLDFVPADTWSYTSGMFILIHGNADTITSTNSGVRWNHSPDQNIADQTIPDSYYLAAAPAFWPATWPWPLIIPGTTSTSVSQSTLERLNPATWRYYNNNENYPDLGGGGEGSTSGSGKGRGVKGSQGRGRMR